MRKGNNIKLKKKKKKGRRIVKKGMKGIVKVMCEEE
jgi:hypothetical protein